MKRLFILAALLVAACPAAAGDDLTPAQERGKLIYTKGESAASRIITAAISTSEAPASASILPCTQCHGLDGRGIGIVSPDINWATLVDPDGHEHLQRNHGAYDEVSLARAIREGVDPAQNKFEPTMPRYTMADEDMADLIAYLKVIDAELDPGLSASTIRIGTVLPTAGPLGGAGTAMKAVIEAYFDSVNASGGVHDRQLELVVGEYGAEDTPAFWRAQDLLRDEALFALVAAYVPGFEDEFTNLVESTKVPHVGPHTLIGSNTSSRYEFDLQAGLAEQAEALVKAVTSQAVVAQADAPRLAVVYPRAKGFNAVGEATADLGGDAGKIIGVPYELGRFDAEAVSRRLMDAQTEAVVFLGSSAEFLALAQQAVSLDWRPTLLAPAILAERAVFDLPDAFAGQVFLAYASLPADRTPDGAGLFEALHSDAGIDYQHSIAQVAAFSAARVLVQGLELAGAAPSRERLVSALESLRDYRPGLTAPVSFGPERRMGPGGAYVVRVDRVNRQLDNERRWVELD